MSTSAKKPNILTLHELLPALSYWGATARLFLISFIAAVVFIIRTSELESAGNSLGQAVLLSGESLLYVVGSFFILEVGFLTIARAYPLRRWHDQLILLGSELLLFLAYFLPYFALIPSWLVAISRYVLFAVLLVLGIRLLVGALYSRK